MSDPYAGSFDEIYGETEDEKRARGKANGPSRSAPLPFIDMSTWDTTPAPARQWLITDYIPLRQPTLLSGEGAIGKSILLLQLLASTPLSQPWIESLWPKPGPTLYLGAEDEQDEIRRRLEPILKHHDMRFSDLIAGGFKALAYAGKDAVLAQFDRSGRIKPTDLFQQLYKAARDLKPSAIAIDTVSDVYLGDEIKREQVRQFGSLMRRLAIDTNSAVIIAAHPSQSGIKSGSGLSGSTQWHNTVRARAYFRKPVADDDDENEDEAPDTGLRELHFLKNQYGPLGRRIQLKWSNGLWLPPSATEDSKSIADQRIEQLFLMLLRRATSAPSSHRPLPRPSSPRLRRPRGSKHREGS
jgi:RecA-family ATPase